MSSDSSGQSLLADDLSQPAKRDRILSLDQFRGYTVVGMLLVNFLGSFKASPIVLLHHHDYCSYADTIMPQFLFAVGFAFRLTFGRRVQREGKGAAYGRMVRRLLGLALVSIVIYTVSPPAKTWEGLVALGPGEILPTLLKRNWFQTLMHIAVTSLWVLPVICASARTRIFWMIASGLAHVGLSYWFNYVWVNSSPNGIDGGPLGFLTWCIPMILGTLTCDAVVNGGKHVPLAKLVGWSLVIMAFAWVISCGTRIYDVPASEVEALSEQKLAENPVWPSKAQWDAYMARDWKDRLAEPPFVPPPDERHRKWNYWMMSQRAGTLSYTTFAGGLAILVYVLFYVLCDLMKLHLAFFRTFGTNALAAYVLHEMVGSAVKPFMPGDSPGWYVTLGLLVFYAITWLFVRGLEKQGAYLRL